MQEKAMLTEYWEIKNRKMRFCASSIEFDSEFDSEFDFDLDLDLDLYLDFEFDRARPASAAVSISRLSPRESRENSRN